MTRAGSSTDQSLASVPASAPTEDTEKAFYLEMLGELPADMRAALLATVTQRHVQRHLETTLLQQAQQVPVPKAFVPPPPSMPNLAPMWIPQEPAATSKRGPDALIDRMKVDAFPGLKVEIQALETRQSELIMSQTFTREALEELKFIQNRLQELRSLSTA